MMLPRRAPAAAAVLALLFPIGCSLPSDEDIGSFAICPFGWCDGQQSGDTGEQPDTDGPSQSSFLASFSETYCEAFVECCDGECGSVGSCEDALSGTSDRCEDYDPAAARRCLDDLADIDSCSDLYDEDWTDACVDVYSDCGEWWQSAWDTWRRK